MSSRYAANQMMYRNPPKKKKENEMSAEKITGLCVGGPYSGQSLAHTSDVITMVVHDDLCLSDEHAPLTLSTFTYKNVSICHPAPNGTRSLAQRRHFWVPEGKDIIWAIDQLAMTFVGA